MSMRSSPDISSANDDRSKHVTVLLELLTRFHLLSQDFFQTIEKFRESVEPSFGERILSFLPFTKKTTENIPLIPGKRVEEKETDKASVARLNAFLSTDKREDTLQYAALGCKTLLEAFQREASKRAEIEAQLQPLEVRIKRKFQTDISQHQEVLSTARKNVERVFVEQQQMIAALSALMQLDADMINLRKEMAEKVIEFDTTVTAFLQQNQDRESLISFVKRAPTLEAMAAFPSTKIDYENLDEQVIKKFLGDEWESYWNKKDRHQEKFDALQKQRESFERTLIERQTALKQLIEKFRAINWDEKQQVIEKLKEEQKAFLLDMDYEEFNHTLMALTNPLLDKVILSTEEKAQQLKLIEEAFDEKIQILTAQAESAAFVLSRVKALEVGVPAEAERVNLDDLYGAIQAIVQLHSQYHADMELLNDIPMFAKSYSDKHAIVLLDRFKCIVPKEIYEAISFAVEDGEKQAQTLLQQAITFMQGIRRDYLAEVERIEKINTEAKAIIAEIRAYDGFGRANTLLQEGLSKKQVVEKHNQAVWQQKVDGQQTRVATQAAQLEQKWVLKPPAWIKEISDDLDRSSKSIDRFANIQKALEDLKRFLKQFEQFPTIMADGSYQYNNIAAKLSVLVKLAQEICAAVENLLANDSQLLKDFMNIFEEALHAKAEVHSDGMLADFVNTFSPLKEEVSKASAWRAQLDTQQANISGLQEKLQKFDEHGAKFAELIYAVKRREDLIQRLCIRVDMPLTIISEQLSGAEQLRLIDIKEKWLEKSVAQFEQDYQVFLEEDKKRQRRALEALEWLQTTKHKADLVAATKQVSESAQNVFSASKDDVDHQFKMAIEVRANLAAMQVELESRIAFNKRVMQLLRKLKQNVMHELKELDQTNPYQLEMVSRVVNDDLHYDSGIWRLINKEKRALNTGHKRVSQRSLNSFEDLRAKLVALKGLLARNAEFIENKDAEIGVSTYANDLHLAVNSLNGFLSTLITPLSAIDAKIEEAKTAFASAVESSLAPIDELQRKIDLSALRDGCQDFERKNKYLLEEAEKLKDAIESMLSDVSLVPFPIPEVKHAKPILSLEVEACLRIMNERKKVHLEALSVTLPPVDFAACKREITSTMQSMLSDESGGEKKENPETALATHKDKLKTQKADIDKKIAELNVLKTRKNNNVDYIKLLTAEKAGLMRAYQNDLGALSDQIKRMFGETAYAKLKEDAGSDAVKMVVAAANRLKQLVKDCQLAEGKHHELDLLRGGLLIKKREEFPNQLKILASVKEETLNLLHINVPWLQASWLKLIERLDQAVMQEELKKQILGFYKVFKEEAEPSFVGVVKAKTIQAFDVFQKADEANYEVARKLSEEILQILQFILASGNELFLHYHEQLISPLAQALLLQEPALWDFYADQMQRINARYSWLIAAQSCASDYDKLSDVANVASQDAMTKFEQWVTQYASPFLNAYQLIQEQEKQIEILDVTLRSLDAEQAWIAHWLPLQETLPTQSETVAVQFALVEVMEPILTQRVKQLEELKSSKAVFDKAVSVLSEEKSDLYVNVSGEVFLRLKHIFLTNDDVKKIVDDLVLRANKHHNEANKKAILALHSQITQCNTNLFDLIDLLERPLASKRLGEGEGSVTLERSRGGQTETCKLIMRLKVELEKLIADHASILHLDDLQNEFTVRSVLLSDPGFFDKPIAEITQQRTSRFDYHCDRLLEQLDLIQTKKSAIVEKIKSELKTLQNADKDELTKFNELREIINREYQSISQSRGGEPALIFFKGSRLGAKLKEQLAQLDLLLASTPKPTRIIGVAERK